MIRRVVALLLLAGGLYGETIDGKWDFVWQTPGGERRSTLKIAVAGEKASVEFPEGKSPMTGTFRDGKLAVTGKLYSAEAGEEGQFQMSATLRGEELKGSASWQEHEMTFTARRAADQGSK